jgi:hypothetical protein
MRSGLAVPAFLVGWSEPGKRPRAVRPGGAPQDAPARGDRHRAWLGAQQGPPLHLLADARHHRSVHSPDLRRGLPGLPSSRPAVLQLRRSAVSGARHRAAGGGAGAAVAGQGDDEGRHCPRRARCRSWWPAGAAAGSGWADATPPPGSSGEGPVLPGPTGPFTGPWWTERRQWIVAGPSFLDIEQRLRRSEVNAAQVQVWLALARELGRHGDRCGCAGT